MKTSIRLLMLAALLLAASGCGRATMKVKLDSCKGMEQLGWAECREWHD